MKLTIIMYHYVREIIGSKFPNIKGLEFANFKNQLDYLQNKYSIIKAEDLIEYAINKKTSLPKNPCYLTFDDGYKDHIEYVLPELKKRKIQGSFFPASKPIINHDLLNTNAIQFILASCEDLEKLIKELNTKCIEYGVSEDEINKLWLSIDDRDRFDNRSVTYVKRMLQRELPEEIRSKVTDMLFEKYVGVSQKDFSIDLYLSKEEVSQLVSEGMYVGSHSHSHYWMNEESLESQKKEIELSLVFLDKIGAPTKDWIMCYPNGAYNDDTLSILRKKKCVVGLTCNVGHGLLKRHKLLELSRFDTNDFPQ